MDHSRERLPTPPRLSYAAMVSGAILLSICGACGQSPVAFTVDGTVHYDDNNPLAGGMVEMITVTAAGKRVNVRGLVDEAGHFVLRTFPDDRDVPPGTYRVAVIPRPQPPCGDVSKMAHRNGLDPRYSNFETSGLKFLVTPKATHVTLKVQHEKQEGIGK
jgi:hypothetical protein